MATSDARRLLPEHLEPVEITHQRSVLSVTAFLFEDPVAGPHSEVMFSVLVPPTVTRWGRPAKAGFYPFLAATSSEEARRFKAEQFHFPYDERSIDTQFFESDTQLRIRVFGGGAPILDLSITPGKWKRTTRLLHGFMMNGEQRLRTTLDISGDYSMHENEGGNMTLFSHPLTQGLLAHEVSPCPFREHWFKHGTKVFHDVEIF